MDIHQLIADSACLSSNQEVRCAEMCSYFDKVVGTYNSVPLSENDRKTQIRLILGQDQVEGSIFDVSIPKIFAEKLHFRDVKMAYSPYFEHPSLVELGTCNLHSDGDVSILDKADYPDFGKIDSYNAQWIHLFKTIKLEGLTELVKIGDVWETKVVTPELLAQCCVKVGDQVMFHNDYAGGRYSLLNKRLSEVFNFTEYTLPCKLALARRRAYLLKQYL